MVERGIGERFCIYWWNDEGKNGNNWIQLLAKSIGWPVAIETFNQEVMDGGGA